MKGAWLRGPALPLLAAALLGAALLRPGLPARQARFDGIVVLDVTQSMNVTDYAALGRPVSRLNFARDALRHALADLPCGSRVGLGIFTEYRSFILLAPLEVCAHFRELAATLDQMDNRMAWAGFSEVAKGLNSALRAVRALPDHPALVFITDGHEAPPINPLHRPPLDVKPGELRGLIVGTGGSKAEPIPKTDPAGNALGFWRADEVMQTDVYQQDRQSSAGDKLVESETAPSGAQAATGGVVGQEHLSALHEDYLRGLAVDTGLQYHRLESAAALTAALRGPAVATPADGLLDLRPIPAGVALVALLLPYAGPLRRSKTAEIRRAAGRSGVSSRPA